MDVCSWQACMSESVRALLHWPSNAGRAAEHQSPAPAPPAGKLQAAEDGYRDVLTLYRSAVVAGLPAAAPGAFTQHMHLPATAFQVHAARRRYAFITFQAVPLQKC